MLILPFLRFIEPPSRHIFFVKQKQAQQEIQRRDQKKQTENKGNDQRYRHRLIRKTIMQS